MTRHKVKVPDGGVLVIDTPDEATEAQVIHFASEHYNRSKIEAKKKAELAERERLRSEKEKDRGEERQLMSDNFGKLAKIITNAIADVNEQSLEDKQDLVAAIQNIRIISPDIVIPDIVIPEIKIPDIVIPDIVIPEIKIPTINVPQSIGGNITVPEPKVQVISHEVKKKSVTEWKFTMVRDQRGLLVDIVARAVKLGE